MPRSCLLGRAVMVLLGIDDGARKKNLLLDPRDIFYRWMPDQHTVIQSCDCDTVWPEVLLAPHSLGSGRSLRLFGPKSHIHDHPTSCAELRSRWADTISL